MAVTFTGDLESPRVALPHFWEHTVGSGHATLALRADWQAQLRRARAELGIRHVRFHGILDDDMGTLVAEGETFFYSFFNTDRIFDFLLSVGMKPFVELSFMPTALASGTRTAFHYLANVTPPRDPAEWSVLIHKLVSHWVERYGIEEVRQWFFEVWNEPNLDVFWDGELDDYLTLYRWTVGAIKSVDPALKVGGPATAGNAWIREFLAHAREHALPVDFVSTHHYPTDAFGKPGDDTEAQLAASRRSVLREQARTARDQAGDLPLYYTEWCTSSNPRDYMHDDPYAAAFIVKTVLEANGLVEGYSYWTFSDIFEENYMPSVPFHGGFGLLNLYGVPKPAYRAFELLHGLGDELVTLEGAHETVDAWLATGDGRATLILTNFALPRHAIEDQSVTVQIAGVAGAQEATIRRIDLEHANAKRRWQQMGEPEYLSDAMVAELEAASAMTAEPHPFACADGRLELSATLSPQSVAAIEIHF